VWQLHVSFAALILTCEAARCITALNILELPFKAEGESDASMRKRIAARLGVLEV
jgi:hypothetical protein